MTKAELDEWVKSSKYVDTIRDEYDDGGTRNVKQVREKDGKLYLLETYDGHYYEKFVKGKGYIRGVHNPPKEITKKTEVVTVEYYVWENGTRIY